MGHEDRGSWDWEKIPQHSPPKELLDLLRLMAEMSGTAPTVEGGGQAEAGHSQSAKPGVT